MLRAFNRAVTPLFIPGHTHFQLVTRPYRPEKAINVAKNEEVQRHLRTTVTQEDFRPTPKIKTLDLFPSFIITSPVTQ